MHYNETVDLKCNSYSEIELCIHDSQMDSATIHLSLKEAIKLKRDLKKCIDTLIENL